MLDLIIVYMLIHAKNISHLTNHQVYFKLVDRDMKKVQWLEQTKSE